MLPQTKEELPAGFAPLAPPVIRAHDPEAAPPQYVVLRCVRG